MPNIINYEINNISIKHKLLKLIKQFTKYHGYDRRHKCTKNLEDYLYNKISEQLQYWDVEKHTSLTDYICQGLFINYNHFSKTNILS